MHYEQPSEHDFESFFYIELYRQLPERLEIEFQFFNTIEIHHIEDVVGSFKSLAPGGLFFLGG